jgi:hypothetical protein
MTKAKAIREKPTAVEGGFERGEFIEDVIHLRAFSICLDSLGSSFLAIFHTIL